ncbi:MAG TPA: hypothetical protein VK395_09990 [Gemmataceae bacterium]|nr:hypothetical protein [Gemmataceae bacterium]
MKKAVLVACGLILIAGSAVADNDDDVPAVKEIMRKLYGGRNGLRAALLKNLKSDKPSWDEIQRQAEEIAKLGAAIGKNDPPRGDQKSWEKFTTTFATNAKAVDTAAQKQNKLAIQTAFNRMGNCTACHSAHKPRKRS